MSRFCYCKQSLGLIFFAKSESESESETRVLVLLNEFWIFFKNNFNFIYSSASEFVTLTVPYRTEPNWIEQYRTEPYPTVSRPTISAIWT